MHIRLLPRGRQCFRLGMPESPVQFPVEFLGFRHIRIPESNEQW